MADIRECLAQLFKDVRNENYKLSKEEFEAAKRCQGKIKSTCLEAFLLAGSVLWSVTGRVQLMPRLIATFGRYTPKPIARVSKARFGSKHTCVPWSFASDSCLNFDMLCAASATAGAILSSHWSAKHCAEEFLTLDGSHMQERLVAILQNQAVLKPRARAILEKYYYLEPMYDDSGQETPGIALRKRELAGISLLNPSGKGDSFGKDPDLLENANNSPRPKDTSEPTLTNKTEEVSNNQLQGHTSSHTVVHDDAFEDPFESLLWSGAEESSKLAMDKKASRKHTGRMGVLERREYNRAQYLQWQEKRNRSEWDNHAQQAEF